MLVALWCEHVGVSRSQYAALLQILLILENIGPIRRLPKTLDHLKKQFWAQFPLLPMRRKKIPVVSTKLPTLSAAERGLVNFATCSLYFQDPIALLTNMARSPKFRSTMHHGMAHFVDEPAELWESSSWPSSIRSTSGEFARYADGSPIFISDVVKYRCMDQSCSCSISTEKHIGRVRAVGKDFTSCARSPGVVTIVVFPYIRQQEAPRQLLTLLSPLKKQPPFAGNELIVNETSFLLREYKQLVQRTNKRDVEKVLLQKESFRRTLLLLIEGVFAEEEPDLSTKILDMYHHCPLVFKDYLRLSDNVPDDPDDETEAWEFALGCYRNIRPWSLLTGKDIQENFQIPLRLTNLGTMHPFAQQL
ncbi:hypothetical protein Egran_06705, partial [Elaphomyces granulatus]